MAVAAGVILGGAIGGATIGWTVGAVAAGALIGGALGAAVENMIPEIPSVDYSKLPTNQSPTYGNQIKQNQARIGGAIPHILGTVRFYPDIVNRPYRLYNAKEYAYYVLSLGNGDLDANNVEFFVGNSPLINFKGVDYVIHAPGEAAGFNYFTVPIGDPQLGVDDTVHHAVLPLGGISGAELAKDADNSGVYGEYLYPAALIAGASSLYINLWFPRGLYDISNGNPVASSVTVHIDVVIYHADQTSTVAVNQDKVIHGEASVESIYKMLNYALNLVEGDEVGITVSRLTDNKTTGGVNECRFGDVLLDSLKAMDSSLWRVPMRIESNAELAKASEKKIMAQVTNPNAATVRQAVEYVWQKAGLNLQDLDASVLDSASVTEINGVIDNQSGVQDMLKKITAIARAYPIRAYDGMQAFYIDAPQAVAATLDDDDIVEDSLKVQMRFLQETDNDGIKVRWFDPILMTEQFATYPVAAVNPKQVDLFGCTVQSVAESHAVYLYKKQLYQNKNISWQTELDGNKLNVGQVVTVIDSYRNINETVMITGISPNQDRVNITAINYDERVYA